MKTEILVADDLSFVLDLLDSYGFQIYKNHSINYTILKREGFICEISSDVPIEDSKSLIKKVNNVCSNLKINPEQEYTCLIKFYELGEPGDWPELNDSLDYVSDELQGQLEQFIESFENPVFYFDNQNDCSLARAIMCELNSKVRRN